MDETEIVAGFIERSKRERYAKFLRSATARPKFVRTLYHFGDFDPAVVVELPASLETRGGVLRELQRRGAGRTCYIISADPDLDRTTTELSIAVDKIFGLVEGTLLSCIPGRLAYYEGEAPKYRFILHRVGSAV